MQELDAPAPIDLTAERLRRNALHHTPNMPGRQVVPNWLDMTTSNIMRMFHVEHFMRPRAVAQGEIWFTTTSLHGTNHYLASEQFLTFSAIQRPEPAPSPRPAPNLQIMVFDRDRPRTENRGGLRLV